MFTDKSKGKITITVEKDDNQFNSNMQCSGIARSKDLTTSTLLFHFVSFALKNGKNPRDIIERNLDQVINQVLAAKKL